MIRPAAAWPLIAHLALVSAIYPAPGRWFDGGGGGAVLALALVVTWPLLAPAQRARSAGAPRVWRGLLLSVGFAAANAGLLVVTARIDRFAIFDGGYLATVGTRRPWVPGDRGSRPPGARHPVPLWP